jgi:putative heme-binding domain-containing protein
MHVATSAEQQRLAASLCGEAGGTDLLLATLTAGKASPQLLHDPQIRERLAAVASPRQWAAIEQWLREAPPAAEQAERLVEARRAAFQERPGDPAEGKAVFRQHCAACHRVAGEGQQVGPNLDGMASRGAARIVEDVLLPHRNVDAAFRATIVTTHSGKVLTGLVRGEPGPDGLLIVDSQGRETLVPRDDLAELTLSGLSPMPGNFGEVLPPHAFNDLLAYLLALRN